MLNILKVNKNLLFSIDKIWKRGYFNIRKAKTFGNREKQNQNQTKIKNKRRKKWAQKTTTAAITITENPISTTTVSSFSL